MMMRRSPLLKFVLFLGSVLGAQCLVPDQLRAENIKVEARLIWGTNEEKSQKPKHEPVDEETAEKFRKIFKWKNYFLEKTVKETVPNRESKRLELSDQCAIEIREMPGAPVEVKLFGKGEFINKTIKPLNRGEWFIIGGDDKNECAWFVVLVRE